MNYDLFSDDAICAQGGESLMAAIPFMPFYVAEYLADAAHLSTLEHGAYMLLIMNYWQRAEPLPDNDRKLARLTRMTDEQWLSIRDDIAEFFDIAEGLWKHGRIERELDRARAKLEQARNAGRASAERRFNGRSTGDEQEFNHIEGEGDKTSPNGEDTPKPPKSKKPKVIVTDAPEGVEAQVWSDFVELRKKKGAPITETALKGIKREADKAGWSFSDALAECCTRGWQGFKADWVNKEGNGNGRSGRSGWLAR